MSTDRATWFLPWLVHSWPDIPSIARILPVLLFVAVSSIFGFVINDIADAELDRKAGKLRNPVASGDLSVAAAWALVVVLLGMASFIHLSS